MKFIDLFAGLGGFHVAMQSLGLECVYAAEKDPNLASLYLKNFGVEAAADLREDWERIPEHDVLCAGFPCQPFSKAGGQLGLNCDENGDLFDYVLKVLALRAPEFAILENVPNLTRHENGETWKGMERKLRALDYDVEIAEFSPIHFGIPQTRMRTFVVCRRGDDSLSQFSWPEKSPQITHIGTVLEKRANARKVSAAHQCSLTVWQDFLDRYPKDVPLPSFPIWSFEFGATYPLDAKGLPYGKRKKFEAYRGSYGSLLQDISSKEEWEQRLPPYVSRGQKIPEWKKRFIEQNRRLYIENKSWIDEWIDGVKLLPNSFRKLEWNWKDGVRRLDRAVLQFRASGIRVKSPTASPSLVALTTSQVPIIGWEGRYLSVREGARLQSLDELKHLPQSETAAFRALGNAVNAEVVRQIARCLLKKP